MTLIIIAEITAMSTLNAKKTNHEMEMKAQKSKFYTEGVFLDVMENGCKIRAYHVHFWSYRNTEHPQDKQIYFTHDVFTLTSGTLSLPGT